MASISGISGGSAYQTASMMSKGLGGLMSGLDTDTLVKNMTAATQARITAQLQAKQKLIWKQEAYRETHKTLTDFKSKFFDLLSPTNLAGKTFYSARKVESSSDAVKVTSSSASASAFTIDYVEQLATAQSVSGEGSFAASLTSKMDVYNSFSGTSFKMEFNGVEKTINLQSLDGIDPASDDFKQKFQKLVDDAFGKDKNGNSRINVSVGTVTDANTNKTSNLLSFEAQGKVVLKSSGNQGLSRLGFTEGQSNRISTEGSLKYTSFADGQSIKTLSDSTFRFKINGVDFAFNVYSTTLQDVIEKVNSSDAGVRMSYSDVTGKVSFTSTQTGAGNHIELQDMAGTNFLATISGSGAEYIDTTINGLGHGFEETAAGKNAIYSIDGQELESASNTVNANGVQLELTKATSEAVKITASKDTDKVFDGILSFIDEYNKIVEEINVKTSEKVYKDYPPLTDEQREEMTESQIKAWEEKAKSGMLARDSTLNSLLNKMRSALFQAVESVGLHLSDLGLTTSTDYKGNDRGKIVFMDVDGNGQTGEDRLRNMIETRYDDVAKFFNDPQQGIAVTLNNVIDDAVRTTGDNKGTLVLLAGVEATGTVDENNISKQIGRIDNTLDSLLSKLTREEDRYWKQFVALEQAMAKLNTQSQAFANFGM